jgi:hypothetical protein
MKKNYVLLILIFAISQISKGQYAQNQSLISPDKQKYFSAGALLGGISYALFYDYYRIESDEYNFNKIKTKAFIASAGTVLGLALLKQTFDFSQAKYNPHADDYVLDASSALLGALSLNLTIQLFH